MKKFKGVGDIIAFILKWTGIKYIVKLINPNCNCDQRQEKINVKLPL